MKLIKTLKKVIHSQNTDFNLPAIKHEHIKLPAMKLAIKRNKVIQRQTQTFHIDSNETG